MRAILRLFNLARRSVIFIEPSANNVMRNNSIRRVLNENRYYQVKSKSTTSEIISVNIETEGFKPMDARKLKKMQAINKVKEALKCTPEQASKIVSENPEISWVPLRGMQETKTWLLEKGLSEEQIRENAWLIMYLPSEIEMKVSAVTDILKISDIQVLIPILTWSPSKLRSVARKWDQERREGLPDKIQFIAEYLKCSPYDVSVMMSRIPFLATFDYARMKAATQIFDAYKMDHGDLFRDFWVVKYNLKTIEHRLKQAKECGVIQIKPWMLRCSDEKFQKVVRRHETERDIIGEHSDILEYLKHRLNCTDQFLNSLNKRNPKPALTNIVKLQQLLDFLFKEGFTSEHIQNTPRILCHSLKLIKERMRDLKDLNYMPENLAILCRTDKEFETFKKKLQVLKIVMKN